jgi:hypothetical protein
MLCEGAGPSLRMETAASKLELRGWCRRDSLSRGSPAQVIVEGRR